MPLLGFNVNAIFPLPRCPMTIANTPNGSLPENAVAEKGPLSHNPLNRN